MNNNQFLPFERNRYYAGKMLTSADFVAEQNYYLNKQRFFNNMMYGSGIVCGLGVVSLDDLSLLVESGVAIDGLGREIVVENSVVKKLSAIEGFDNLETENVTLALAYSEKEDHSVYSVGHAEGENEYEYNRITEGYRLYLVDTDSLIEPYEDEGEFLTKEILYSDLNYMVTMEIPNTVSKGRNVRILVKVEKISAAEGYITYHGTLQTPGFENADGERYVDISIESVALDVGQTWQKEYWLKVVESEGIETSIILDSGSVSVEVAGEPEAATDNFAIKVMLENSSPLDIISRAVGTTSLEMRSIGEDNDYIKLADLALVRTETAYVIEEVKEKAVKEYISIPSQEKLRNRYMEFFAKDVDISSSVGYVETVPQQTGIQPQTKNNIETASGVLEIPLGTDAREGDICYSGEIIHGLGAGNVYVNVGYEFLNEDVGLEKGGRNTVYGNSQLFEESGIAEVETAVKVLNDKGSFVVAAKLLRDVEFLTLTYRWVAIRFPSSDDIRKLENIKDKSISAETPTFVMSPKESHYFGVRYHNMEPASLTYELTEPASGEITADGIYTAPSKEGVYEIKIYCSDAMLISTYAYAIVKKKDYDE